MPFPLSAPRTFSKKTSRGIRSPSNKRDVYFLNPYLSLARETRSLRSTWPGFFSPGGTRVGSPYPNAPSLSSSRLRSSGHARHRRTLFHRLGRRRLIRAPHGIAFRLRAPHLRQ